MYPSMETALSKHRWLQEPFVRHGLGTAGQTSSVYYIVMEGEVIMIAEDNSIKVSMSYCVGIQNNMSNAT